MNYLIGVDLGTSGTKTVLFDTEGTVISSATVEYPMYQPKNGWAEQAPEDWWDATMRTTKKVIEDSGVDSKDIKGMGISGQMHGLVALDEQDRVIRPAILWNDGRSGCWWWYFQAAGQSPVNRAGQTQPLPELPASCPFWSYPSTSP